MTTIIEAQSITKIYTTGENTVKAVDDISFSVHAGEFVALVGPSGSGKTTMLAMLAVLLNPTNGTIIIDGADLNKLKESERVKFRREKIGFAFQSHNLVPYLTIQENVELMLRLNGKTSKQDREYTIALLTQMGLEERLTYLPNQVSGGQRQRAAIARAVVHNPRLLLADEPTANLDTERAYQAVKIFADLIHGQDRCGIMVTHDLRMCRYVDKVIQMEDGKLVRVIEKSQDIEEFARGH
jgi:putative ABC transport system ATP-binding protein